MKLGHVFLIFFVLLMMSSGANALYSYTDSTNILYASQVGDITLDDFITNINNSSIIYTDGQGYYWTMGEIYLGTNTRLWINDSYCNVLDLDDTGQLYFADTFYLDGIEIRGGVEIGNFAGTANNLFINGTAGGLRIESFTTDVDNITGQDFYGIKFADAEGISITNLTTTNTTNLGIQLDDCNNITMAHLNFSDVSDYTSPSTGKYGLSIDTDCYNVTVDDLYINGTGWSALSITDGANYVWVNDVIVNNSGHNSLDIHGNQHVWVDNFTDYNPQSNNVLITYTGDPIQGTYDIHLSNISSYNSNAGSEWNGLQMNGGVGIPTHNITIVDYIFDTGDANRQGNGLSIGDYVYDLTMINGTVNGYDNSISSYGANSYNISLIDLECTNSDRTLLHTDGTNVIYANVNISTSSYTAGNYTVMYPINAYVVNTTGYPVTNANITVNVTTFGLNGLGEYSISGVTYGTGKLNYSQRLYVPDYLYDGNYTYYNLNTVSVEKNGISNESSAFNPDETWYSTNLSALNGTEIILTLDLSPITIDSYLPLIDPTSTEGDTQEFSVNLSKSANVTWYIDSVEVQINTSVTSASYTNSTAPVGVYNVTTSAYDGSTYANQSWAWTVEETAVPTSETMLYNAIDDIDSATSLATIILTVVGGVSIIVLLAAIPTYNLDPSIALTGILVIIIGSVMLYIGIVVLSGMVAPFT